MPSLKTEFAHPAVNIFDGKPRLKDGLVWLFGGGHGRGLLDIGRQKMAKGKMPKPNTFLEALSRKSATTTNAPLRSISNAMRKLLRVNSVSANASKALT